MKDSSSRISTLSPCPFSPSQGEKVAEGRMRGFVAGSDAVQSVTIQHDGQECPSYGITLSKQDHFMTEESLFAAALEKTSPA